jgi:hypothetical protein
MEPSSGGRREAVTARLPAYLSRRCMSELLDEGVDSWRPVRATTGPACFDSTANRRTTNAGRSSLEASCGASSASSQMDPRLSRSRRCRCRGSRACSSRVPAARDETEKRCRWTGVWTKVWIACPHSIPVSIGVCGLCRALTPPKHDGVLGRGQGPAQEVVGGETGWTVERWRDDRDRE